MHWWVIIDEAYCYVERRGQKNQVACSHRGATNQLKTMPAFRGQVYSSHYMQHHWKTSIWSVLRTSLTCNYALNDLMLTTQFLLCFHWSLWESHQIQCTGRVNNPLFLFPRVWCGSRRWWEPPPSITGKEGRLFLQPAALSFHLFGTLCGLTTLRGANECWILWASANESLCSIR